MKKFGLFISFALLAAFVGCDNDDTEDPGVAAVAKPVVAVSENTPTSFGVEWDAVEKAAAYKYAVTQTDAEGNTAEFRPETQTDVTSLHFDNVAAGMKYTVRVKALAESGSQLADSEYAEVFVETPVAGASAQAFSFTVVSTGYDSASVKVQPAKSKETYCFAVVKNSLMLDKNNNAIIEMLTKNLDPESLVKGTQTIETKWLDPETSYVAVAFGYDAEKGTSTSLLSRSEKFQTTADSRMSIDVSVLSVGDESIAVKCTPSVSNAPYFVTAVAAADVAGKSDREILAGRLKALNAKIAASGWDAVAAEQLRSGASSYSASGLSLGTEYVIVAFGVQKSAAGKAEETTRLFKAKAKTTAPEAVVKFTTKIVDGSQFTTPFPGKAGVGFQFEPNAATKSYAYGVFKEVVLEGGYSDSELIAILTGDPASMIDAANDPDENFRGYYIMDWGEKIVIMTVGFNAIGQPGPLRKEIVVVTDSSQGGGGTTTPTERCNASVEMETSVYKDSDGSPSSGTTFTPSADCARFRFIIGVGAGAAASMSEETLIGIFNDESYNAKTNPRDGLWYDSSLLGEDRWAGMSYYETALGKSLENIALAYNAEGVAGKITVETFTFPSSLDDLPVGASVPTSSMIRSAREISAVEMLNMTPHLNMQRLR